jgi:GNAT superfamily N-acetyltransferase
LKESLMPLPEAFSTRLLSPASASARAVVSTVTTLVNDVYAVAEEGLWEPGTSRTIAAEVEALIGAGEIAVAVDGERIVGCVRVQLLTGGAGEFGMLAVDPSQRREGLGSALVRFAEQWCRGNGRESVQLELLVPRGWTHPVKAFLADWYGRIGYEVVRVAKFEESYPELARRLATPCDFLIYRKNLQRSGAVPREDYPQVPTAGR